MQLSDSRQHSSTMPASLMALLAFSHVMAYADRNLPAVAAPLLKTHLGLSDAQMGLLDGPAFALLYAVGVLASWPLAHARQRVRILAGCVALWMAGMLVFALGHSFAMLAAGRALVGLGQALFMPLAMGLVVSHAIPVWRARSMAVLTAASVVGRSFSMLLGGAALALLVRWAPAHASSHWRWLFLVMAVPNVWLIVGLLRQPELRPSTVPQVANVFARLFAVLCKKPLTIAAYLLGAAASVLIVRTLGAWAPSVLHREEGLTPAAAALVFGVASLIASPLGHVLAGTLVDRRGERRSPMTIVAGALLLAMPVIGVMPWMHSVMAECLLLALASLLSGAAVVAALSGWPALFEPSLRDLSLRVFLVFIAVMGEALGPWMAGVVSDHLGIGGHDLSLALSRVCAGAAIAGIATALLARAGWRRSALGVAG